MPVQMRAEQVREQLEQLRVTAGEDAFEKARSALIENFIHKPNGDAFLANVFPGLDTEALKLSTPKPLPPEAAMMAALQHQIPSITTQAHFDTFVVAFEALKGVLDATYRQDEPGIKKSREALDKALLAARQVAEVAEKLKEIPEELRSKAASEVLAPPKQFEEQAVQARLLQELATFTDGAALSTWYAEHRSEMDRIVNQALRNQLFDAIRTKRTQLAS